MSVRPHTPENSRRLSAAFIQTTREIAAGYTDLEHVRTMLKDYIDRAIDLETKARASR